MPAAKTRIATTTVKIMVPIKHEPNKERYVVEVKDSDAHAWTQIYLNGIGWINIDATPAGTGIAPAAKTRIATTTVKIMVPIKLFL